MNKTYNILCVLNAAVGKIEKEIKDKENLIDDLEWDLQCAKDRVEYLKVQLKDVKAHIDDIKEDS